MLDEFFSIELKEEYDIATSHGLIEDSVSLYEPFDVISMLKFGHEDNFLVTCDGERVSVENTPRGKHILIWCTMVPVLWNDFSAKESHALSALYSEISQYIPDCQMVIVAKMRRGWEDDKAAFTQYFSSFPSTCLAVPFEDSERRFSLCASLFVTGGYCIKAVFLSPDQLLLHTDVSLFAMHGAPSCAFPFTPDKLRASWDEPKEASGRLIRHLLELPADERLNRVGNEDGDKDGMTVEQLEQCHVALYICCRGNFIEKLNEVYIRCHELGNYFEVVLVYFPGVLVWNLSLFQEFIHGKLDKLKITWLVSPFVNSVSRRLRYICELDDDDRVLMVGPNGSFLDPYGASMMESFGSGAYPFCRDLFLVDEYRRLRDVTLRSILVDGSRDYVIRGSTHVPVADVEGKDIFVYLDTVFPNFPGEDHLYRLVVNCYQYLKDEGKDVEVVFICLPSQYADEHIEGSEFPFEMPFLVCPYASAHSRSVFEQMYIKGTREYELTGNVVAFSGGDGRVCSLFSSDLLMRAACHRDNSRLKIEDRLQDEIDERLANKYEFMM